MKKRRILLPTLTGVKRRIILEVGENGAKAALIEENEPLEFITTQKNDEGAVDVGGIYVGIVEHVHKNGFAFVDIGAGKNAFLNLNDNKDTHSAQNVKAGKPLTVQVTKEAVREKGACVTTKLTWPGRFFVAETVITDGRQEISVSKKITSEKERERLTAIAGELMERYPLGNRRLIIRTEAINAARSSMETEMAALSETIEKTDALAAEAMATETDDYKTRLPVQVYKPYDDPVSMMAAELMASAGYNVKEIIVNDNNAYETLRGFYAGRSVKVVLQNPAAGLFSRYDLEKSLDMTKRRAVSLPSGGQIVIDRTEACVVVDVNSGQYEGKKDMEEMAIKINLEAARETARQLRLRNLSGAILIDFIGMNVPEHVIELTEELKNALAKDRAATVVEGMTRLGFMEMTRKRIRNPLWG